MEQDFGSVLARLFDYYVAFEGERQIVRFVEEVEDRCRFPARTITIRDDSLYDVAAAGIPEAESPPPGATEQDTRTGL